MSVAAPSRTAARVRIVDDLPAAAWNAYVSSRADATSAHRAEWRGVIERAFGLRTRYLAVLEDDRVAGVLPLVRFASRLFGRFVVSMPFLNYGGVLADSADAAQALLDAAIDETRLAGGRHLELRHSRRQFPALAPKQHKVAMRLPLAPDAEGQWDALDRKVRSQVRKAEKNGLAVRTGGAELLDVFYAVFARNMRDLGTPVYGRAFFGEIGRAFPESSCFVTVWLGDRPVAASLVLWTGGVMEVPWASSVREFNALAPNMLLYWAMIREAIERRCQTFDFGRSTPGEGTFHFKRQWGAEPLALVWEYWLAAGGALPDLSPKNRKFSAAIAVWRRLPVAVTKVLGPVIVRNIP